ncbi:Reticulon-like protein 1 [Nakaseomyces glabratus]|uniref:Reticulon-like protein n=1 Tax=Candida glabrata TaxID=5478 RepID=A0A0W0DES0_CANGB|nr:Reticulon-like protein 1 [Nakaseomyces glabratus]KTB05343.1 Reticulon-like protein 1 [Nakaseomyces glabratus]KTB10319.1 Reticulon-like protein 1 [Nakaseomyces glabratus]KTB22913.1 Reticulon-like protein 1 [Nakaseomyces glabratus]
MDTQKENKCHCDCDLLLWRNPLETGKVFGTTLVALLILKKVNLLTFFLRVGYTILLSTSLLEFSTKLVLGQGLVTKYGPKDCPNVVGMIKPVIDNALKQMPVKQAKMRQLVFANSPKQTFKAAVVLYLLHKFFSWFSVWTILFVGDIALFTLPLVYKTYQKEIDAVVAEVLKITRQKTQEYSKVACEKSKPYLEKLGPISKMVESKLNQVHPPTVSSAAPNTTAANIAADIPINENRQYDNTNTMDQGISTAAQMMPNIPEAHPSATKEFDVDHLKDELKQSTQHLQNQFEQNQ